MTVDSSQLKIEPGLRATESTLSLSLRTSRGGEHGAAGALPKLPKWFFWVPIVIAYTTIIYRYFRGKVVLTEDSY